MGQNQDRADLRLRDGYAISGNKAFIVYRIDADHAEWGTMKMSEVAIQEWSNGKVVREKFVY